MLNFLENNNDMPERLRKTFIWFVEKNSQIWEEYFGAIRAWKDQAYEGGPAGEEPEASVEPAKTDQRLAEKRKALIKEGVASFLSGYSRNEEDADLIKMFLITLDKDLEAARDFYRYPDCYLESSDTRLDCFITAGYHASIMTVIVDSLEDTRKDAVLSRYKTVLDRQADALHQEEEQLEMLWDDVYLINVKDGEPELVCFYSLIERQYAPE